FLVSRSNVISAKSAKGVIHVDPRGFCWSSFDPRDEILPIIPNLLETPKEGEPLQELVDSYFTFAKSKAKTVVKVSTRVESSTLWKDLRVSGECGLTPDEHAVVSLLFKKAKGECRLLTDYPTDGSTLKIYGRRRYYESEIRASDACSTLRSVGRKAFRNSYLPSNGALIFESLDLPSRDEIAHLFQGLGEWCYFHRT
ncbi:MAG TPA: hypothetical protein VGR53_09480, partial [Nitrososphaerales archaeon]|nr:hypothetical protein [Nitrososphaerales archaeon]